MTALAPPRRPAPLDAVRSVLSRQEWARLGGLFGIIAGLFVLGFVLVGVAAPHHYRLPSGGGVYGFGTGVLALTLGMRHAFDADHIAAIDNTTRTLVNDGKRPLSVGFFFSLGHSSVVLVLALLLNAGVRTLDRQVTSDHSALHAVAGVWGSSVSGLFLYAIAALNLAVLVSIARVFRSMRQGRYDDAELEQRLAARGLMNRFLGPLARRVDAPWKMYPLGMLFGLGFDTATEVVLLVVAGDAVTTGLPWWAIVALPILFAAGMSLFDTLDGCFMNFAYSWAFFRPVRKVYYNLTITGLSVAVAFAVGSIELLGLVRARFGIDTGLISAIAGVDLNTVGYAIVGLFVVTWAVALAVWRWGRVEQRWEAAAASARAAAFGD